MRVVILAATLMLLTVLFQSCDKDGPFLIKAVSDVEKTNAVRRELGIREIKDDWEFYIHQFNTDKWKHGGFICKTVHLNEELQEILFEQDLYYTDTTWTDVNGATNREFATVIYDYTDKLFTINYCGQQPKLNALLEGLECHGSGRKAKTNEETLKCADKLLTSLGLSRL